MNRTTFQELAEERARDAWALHHARQWSGVYYLTGYAVECGLKACIAKLINQYDYPNKKFANDCYTHDIGDLVKLAGLQARVKDETDHKTAVGKNWVIVKDWDEQARYQRWTELAARKMFTSVTDSRTGVLPWIKGHW